MATEQQGAFSVDDTETVIKSAIGSVLTDAEWKGSKVEDQSNSIIAATLKGLQSLNRPYKYAVTVILMQKVGAGLVSAASTFWDATSDGLCKVCWENQSIHCIVTVLATSVNVSSKEDQDEPPQDVASPARA